jgi:hypothetical protein
MKYRTTHWIAAAGAALTLVTTAAASNSSSYADPGGDSASAPDVTSVVVANSDAGAITFKAGIGNRAAFTPQDWVTVMIDVDLKENAEGFLDPEYAVTYTAAGPVFAIRNGESWATVPAPLLTGFGGSFQGGVATLTINQMDLGDATFVNFWLFSGTEADESTDDAPDGDAVWEYRIVSPSLYVLTFDPPKTAVAGKRVIAGMKVRGAKPGSSRIVCAANVGGKRVAGTGSWFRITLLGRTIAQPRCTWIAPKTAKGKLLRGTMSVVQSGLQVSRTFSVRVR